MQVTPDEKYIYVGRKELKVLENRNGRYKLMNNNGHIKPFIDLKLMPNRDIILFDELTSDLIKYNQNLEQIQRLPGKRPINLNGNEIVTTLYSGDDNIYIWMLGDGSIGLCNPHTMVFDLCANFFGSSVEKVTPFTAVASVVMSKVVGMYLKDLMIYFVFLDGDQGLVRRL